LWEMICDTAMKAGEQIIHNFIGHQGTSDAKHTAGKTVGYLIRQGISNQQIRDLELLKHPFWEAMPI
jgi:hypothetical protein